MSSLESFRDEILKLYVAGMSLSAIARHLQREYDVQATHQSVNRLVQRELQHLSDTDDAGSQMVKNVTYTVAPTPVAYTATATTMSTNASQSVFTDAQLMREYDMKIPAPKKSQVDWGFGGANLVAPAGHGDAEVVVFLSDVHFPYQDEALLRSAIHLIDQVQPDRVILNGDINDFFQLSRFNTSRERLDDLQTEIDMANEFRSDVREAAPAAVIDETEGNHDSRIRTFVNVNAKALHTLDAIRPGRLFCYDELGINWHPGAGFLLRKEFLVKHGTIVRGECPATAKAEQHQAGVSGISGHTHRLGTYRRSGYVKRQWTEQGGLMRIDPDYVVGIPNWTQGCVIGEFSYTSPAFRIHEVPAVNGKLHLFGASL